MMSGDEVLSSSIERKKNVIELLGGDGEASGSEESVMDTLVYIAEPEETYERSGNIYSPGNLPEPVLAKAFRERADLVVYADLGIFDPRGNIGIREELNGDIVEYRIGEIRNYNRRPDSEDLEKIPGFRPDTVEVIEEVPDEEFPDQPLFETGLPSDTRDDDWVVSGTLNVGDHRSRFCD